MIDTSEDLAFQRNEGLEAEENRLCSSERNTRSSLNSGSGDWRIAAKKAFLLIAPAWGTLSTYGWYKITCVAFLGSLNHLLIILVEAASSFLIEVAVVGLTAR